MYHTYIATFFSHFGAIRFSRELKKKGMKATVMPVPRNLSSSCGTCVSYESEKWDAVGISEELEQIVQVVDKGYQKVFEG